MERKQALEGVKSSLSKIWNFAAYEKSVLQKKSYIWLILAFAAITRLYGLGSLGVNKSELVNIDRIFSVPDLGSLYRGDLSTSLYYILQYLWGRIIGFSVINMRAFSILLSLVGLYFFFLFVREWFSKRSAYISTFLLSISGFYILASRAISHEVLYMAVIFPALYLLTLAYRRRKMLYFISSGLLLGALFYTTEISFVLFLVFVISIVYFYLQNKKFLTGYIKETAILAGTALSVSIPFMIWFVQKPRAFLSYFSISPYNLVENGRNLMSSIVFSSPVQLMFNVGQEKIFDPYVEVTFLLGLIYVVLKYKRRKFYFLASWFALLFLVVIMIKSFSVANFIYLVPMIFIFSAVIQSYVLKKWFKTFPFNKFARLTMALGIGFFFALSLSYNYKKVFLAWGKNPNRVLAYNEKVSKVNFKNEEIYVYKSSLSGVEVQALLKNGGKNNITDLKSLSQVKNKGSVNILTSPNNVFAVKSILASKKTSIIEGQSIILVRGE